ncbi:unnamed protein product [Parnassius mnemosyne]|uniref:Uncharacterized protein n=1 Tax=Parnassius mnemosyne TaxID=213953 RepID=A0AAV1MBT4_9NEOP
MLKQKKKYHVKTGLQLRKYWEQRRGKYCDNDKCRIPQDESPSEIISHITSVNSIPKLNHNENSAAATADTHLMSVEVNKHIHSQDIEPQRVREKSPELYIEKEQPEKKN